MKKTKIILILFVSICYQAMAQDIKVESLSKEETKALIVKNINEYGFEEDNFKQRYIATFEGDFLRLAFTKRNKKTLAKKGFLYDFSNVYKFDKISKRSEKLSFINIWSSIMVNEKKKKWDKHKLIMRVEEYENALTIVNLLKHYNFLLLQESER